MNLNKNVGLEVLLYKIRVYLDVCIINQTSVQL